MKINNPLFCKKLKNILFCLFLTLLIAHLMHFVVVCLKIFDVMGASGVTLLTYWALIFMSGGLTAILPLPKKFKILQKFRSTLLK